MRPIAKSSWATVMVVIAVIAIRWLEQRRGPDAPAKPQTRQTENTRPAPPLDRSPPAKGPAEKPVKTETSGAYEVYRNCTLVEARNNDGDSFMVRLPDGREAEFRLYFVDTPESAFKRYAGGETNYERIRQQAAELGGITPEQAVETGKKGKAFTLGLLASRPFTIFTCWDSPFHDNRYHAFVEIIDAGKTRWLHEVLVEHGLVRIKTKPADLPDGTPAARQREHLRELEREAKRNATGVWGLD